MCFRTEDDHNISPQIFCIKNKSLFLNYLFVFKFVNVTVPFQRNIEVERLK